MLQRPTFGKAGTKKKGGRVVGTRPPCLPRVVDPELRCLEGKLRSAELSLATLAANAALLANRRSLAGPVHPLPDQPTDQIMDHGR
jgi:hypothetical protein